MPTFECPHCGKDLNIPEKFAGRNVKCPGCGGALAVPSADPQPEPPVAEPPKAGIVAAAPGRSRPRRGRREPEEKGGGGGKSYLKLGLLGCLGFVVLVICAGLFFWWQEESFRDYARDRIVAQNLDAEKQALMLRLAEHDHGAALSQAAPRNAQGRRMDMAASKEKYFEVLQKMINERYAKLKSGRKPEARTLADYWEQVDHGNGARHVVRLSSDGTYLQLAFGYLDSDYHSLLERFSGKWEFKDGALVWHYEGKADANPIVGYSGLDFALKEMDGSYTYWRKIVPTQRLQAHFGKFK